MQASLKFYQSHLEQQILPFWRTAADDTNGGVFTGYDNQGERLLNTDKYTWSQGRYLWLVSHLTEAAEAKTLNISKAYYAGQAHKTACFLLKHAILPDGCAAFLLSADGQAMEPSPGGGLASSIYADFNLLFGLAEYARVFRDGEVFDQAWNLYHSIGKRIESKVFRCDPYPTPSGMRSHGISMLLLYTAEQLLRAALVLNRGQASLLARDCRRQIEDIMYNFRQPTGRLVEVLGGNGVTLLERHCTPGHMLECSWFVLHAAELLGETDKWLDQVLETVRQALALGWDNEYGGLFRFVDRDGGKPTGQRCGLAMETLLEASWSLKLWWVHSEALYMTFLAWQLSRQEEFRILYEKIGEYTFRTFPCANVQGGDWIQVRMRDGKPLDAVTSVPGKDPFHIVRNLLLLIERINGTD